MDAFVYAGLLLSALVAALTVRRRPPRGSGFAYHFCLNAAAVGFAWGAANVAFAGRMPHGPAYHLRFSLSVVIPAVLLLAVAIVLGVRTKRAREGWRTALVLNGLTFAGLLVLGHFTRWNWW